MSARVMFCDVDIASDGGHNRTESVTLGFRDRLAPFEQAVQERLLLFDTLGGKVFVRCAGLGRGLFGQLPKVVANRGDFRIQFGKSFVIGHETSFAVA